MMAAAQKKGVDFYGASEHFNYDLIKDEQTALEFGIDEAEYFHTARHLQEDYAGCMNVLVGAEFGFSDEKTAQEKYCEIYEKYRPDYVINSIHSINGNDYYFKRPFFNERGEKRSKTEVYGEYLRLLRQSLDAPYPYDIVGHIEYPTRYAPYDDVRITQEEFGDLLDGILKTIIEKNKILEINSSSGGLEQDFLPGEEWLKRYYALGGRQISFGSDAHDETRILDKWEKAVETLKKIGFTYLTVPNKGEYIKIEL
jgi:histidinol-phosphatase (PHP family)